MFVILFRATNASAESGLSRIDYQSFISYAYVLDHAFHTPLFSAAENGHYQRISTHPVIRDISLTRGGGLAWISSDMIPERPEVMRILSAHVVNKTI